MRLSRMAVLSFTVPNQVPTIKTKWKKQKEVYHGAHGSGSAKQKAKYREQRANRHKNKLICRIQKKIASVQ